MFVIVTIIFKNLQPVALHTLQISLAVQALLQKAFVEKCCNCMNQKGFWSSKFALLFSSLVLEFKAAYVRESICGCTLPGALSTVSIFASSELPACFWSFFVRLFCFMSFRMSGQLLSHPKDKLALKFLPPVLNVAKVFFFICCVWAFLSWIMFS